MTAVPEDLPEDLPDDDPPIVQIPASEGPIEVGRTRDGRVRIMQSSAMEEDDDVIIVSFGDLPFLIQALKASLDDCDRLETQP